MVFCTFWAMIMKKTCKLRPWKRSKRAFWPSLASPIPIGRRKDDRVTRIAAGKIGCTLMTDDASSLEPSSTGRLMTAPSNTPSQTARAASSDAPWVNRLFGWLKPTTNGTDLRTDLEDALEEDQSIGHDFSPEERLMLRNILRLRETRTEDVMVPRADIVAIDQLVPLGQVLEKLRSSGHSRMPVLMVRSIIRLAWSTSRTWSPI
jgi:hypothetical protein